MKRDVLELLESAQGGYLSGQSMAEAMGVSRAAVWKQIKRLRDAGYEIQAVTNLGYRLAGKPETISMDKLLEHLGDHPWRDRITLLDSVDSTNSLAKREALHSAPHGSVFIAEEQTGGRGRQGRSFSSPRGKGVYLSVLLRPACAPSQVPHATAMAAVAVCDAVEKVCGVRPGIKWTNDLLMGEKKLCGILSEMSAEWESGTLESLVIGVGVNCGQTGEDFPEELREKATSIFLETGERPDRNQLAAALIQGFYALSRDLLTAKDAWISRYASDCLTLGRHVRILRGDRERRGVATGIDGNGALIVRYDTGETGTVFSGEVSIRGENGYI